MLHLVVTDMTDMFVGFDTLGYGMIRFISCLTECESPRARARVHPYRPSKYNDGLRQSTAGKTFLIILPGLEVTFM